MDADRQEIERRGPSANEPARAALPVSDGSRHRSPDPAARRRRGGRRHARTDRSSTQASAHCLALSIARSATRICASPVGAASSSTTWRRRSRLRKSIAPYAPDGSRCSDLFDEADRLEVVAPVERRAQPQAGQRVGDRHLRGGLPLMFAADGVFGRQLARAQMLFDRVVQRRQVQPVLAHALQQPDDKRHVRRSAADADGGG